MTGRSGSLNSHALHCTGASRGVEARTKLCWRVATGRACTDAGGVCALSGAEVTGTRAPSVAVLASGIIGPGRRMEARGRFYGESHAHVLGSINCWAPLTCVGSRLDRCMRDAAFNLHLSAPLPRVDRSFCLLVGSSHKQLHPTRLGFSSRFGDY